MYSHNYKFSAPAYACPPTQQHQLLYGFACLVGHSMSVKWAEAD